jgi:hypothetical protein
MNATATKFTVYTKLYPQLGGLGWVAHSSWSTRDAANAERNRLISEHGHEPKRVGVNV